MGGIDKPLQLLAGRPLIQRIVERVRLQVSEVMISANRNREQYRYYAERVVDDGAFLGCGPLAGLAAGLAAASGEWLLCVPGDAPAIPLDLRSRLAAGLAQAHTDIAYVQDGTGPQRLCCLIRSHLARDLYAFLQEGGNVPAEWFARHRPASVDFSDWPQWAWSVNTLQQWRAAERQLAMGELA